MFRHGGASTLYGRTASTRGRAVLEILGIGLSAVVPLLGGLVWLVRLEGRINVGAARQDATDKRVDGLEDRILSQLDRIESKLDGKADKP